MVLDLMQVYNLHYQTVVGDKNVIILGVDNSLSVHVDNKKNILVLGSGPQGRSSTKIVGFLGQAWNKCWPPWLADRENLRF